MGRLREEAGIGQWSDAVERSSRREEWQVHGPLAVSDHFEHSTVAYRCDPVLNLDTKIRQHQATGVHEFVANLLAAKAATENKRLAMKLDSLAYHLRIIRELSVAEEYLRTRYREDPQALRRDSGSWLHPRIAIWCGLGSRMISS